MTKQESILKAAARLFAKQGYNAVGIREIAREAEVNSAMISYYFGSKSGLLREIFSRFIKLVDTTLELSINEATTHYDLCELSTKRFLKTARTNRDIFLIGIRELNNDSEILQDLRDELHIAGWKRFSSNVDRLGIVGLDDEMDRDITFTCVMGAIFSDYLLGGGAYIDNDEYVDRYASVIIRILQNGMPNMDK